MSVLKRGKKKSRRGNNMLYNPFSPNEVPASTGLIHASKYRYLIDFRTLTIRTSKMQMQIIIDRFLRSEKSKEYKLNAYERIILLMLASWMGDKLNCWPSYKSLSKDCSISHDSLSKYIMSLESKKLLFVKRNPNKNNEYEFTKLILDSISDIVDNNKKSTRSQRVGTRQERVGVHADSVSNNINNNINNNNDSVDNFKKSHIERQTTSFVKGGRSNGHISKLLSEYKEKIN